MDYRGGESLSRYLMFQVYLAAQRGACAVFSLEWSAATSQHNNVRNQHCVCAATCGRGGKTVAFVLKIDDVN